MRAPIISRSAARYVMRSAAPALVTELIAAAEESLSYRDLEARFRREAFSGRELHIDAHPADQLVKPILDATTPARRAGD